MKIEIQLTDEDVVQSNQKLNAAIIFATEHHAGQFRKGTTRPYILHPLETLQILNTMRADTNLLIAGVLHDTIEDTDATAEMIKESFGEDVANLVAAHSEDKSKSWKERKTLAIEELEKADTRLQMLVMADKVSNLRNLLIDYRQLGDAVWERFNAPVDEQAWYYDGILDALSDLQDDEQCAKVYAEMITLYEDIFEDDDWDEQIEEVETGFSANYFLVKDDTLLQGWDSPVYAWLKAEGFSSDGHDEIYEMVNWVPVNLDAKIFVPGVSNIGITPVIGSHAITFDEFQQIYKIYQKYEGFDVLKMTVEEQREWEKKQAEAERENQAYWADKTYECYFEEINQCLLENYPEMPDDEIPAYLQESEKFIRWAFQRKLGRAKGTAHALFMTWRCVATDMDTTE